MDIKPLKNTNSYINQGIKWILLFIFLILTSSIFSQEPEDVMYVKNFSISSEGGASFSQVDFIRKEFLEEVQKLKKFKLVGPEAEEAIKAEQEKIEAEGGASMMCRADECRRRLLRVSSADFLVEGIVGKVGPEINEIKLEIHGRKVVSTENNTEKKEQTLNVYSVRYKVQKDEKDSIRMLTLASKILAKKISGARVTKDEEAQVSGLKPLGRDDLDYLARSAFLPGWGQFERGNYAKAFLFGGAFLAAAIQANKSNNDYSALNRSYRGGEANLFGFLSFQGAFWDFSPLGTEPAQQLINIQIILDYRNRYPYRESVLELNNSLSILGGIYTLTLLDAFFSSSKYYLDRSQGFSFDFHIVPNFYSYHQGTTNLQSGQPSHSYFAQINYRF